MWKASDFMYHNNKGLIIDIFCGGGGASTGIE